MPYRSKTACPSCGKPKEPKLKLCENCKPVYRGNPERYTYRWSKLSLAYRAENPLCEHCLEQGRTTIADHVHHIQPAEQFPDLFYTWSNLAALCIPCHNICEPRVQKK